MKRERQQCCHHSPFQKHRKVERTTALKSKSTRETQLSDSIDSNKRRKINIRKLFNELKIVPNTTLLESKKDYMNSFDIHSNNFRRFFMGLHAFLTTGTKDIMNKIQDNWMKLIEPVRSHLDCQTIALLHDKSQIEKWHFDLVLAETAAKALQEEAAKWEMKLHETRFEIEIILQSLK